MLMLHAEKKLKPVAAAGGSSLRRNKPAPVKATDPRLGLLNDIPSTASMLANVARESGLLGDDYKANELRKFFEAQSSRGAVQRTTPGRVPHYALSPNPEES